MKFDWFVLPFTTGLLTLIFFLSWKYYKWIKQLDASQRKNFWKIIFSYKIFKLVKEIFLEVLVHRRIYKINPLLGYMHSSFALGWFLLIVFGAIETYLFATKPINHLYEPIFFKYFNLQQPSTHTHILFAFIMDLLLLYILSGISLAIIKRFYSALFGLKKTTKLFWTDKVALYSLWLIFPLRLLAESSTTAIYQNGSFLTNNTGILLQEYFSIAKISYTLWWAYSIDLMIFFIFLPFSRYMHIPTEMILIALRHCGFKTEKSFDNFSKIEIYSCSSCGICIDTCQMQTVTERNNMIPAYLFQKERHGKVLKIALYDCLICGRCENTCPVQINILNIKLARRKERIDKRAQQFHYLNNITLNNTNNSSVAYYAGCMSHLTPSITRSIISIFEKFSTSYTFIDENGTICCGRPLILAGKYKDAQKLIAKNTEIIEKANVSTLITSCPICYKVFKTEYKLKIPVLHHSEWLYLQIIQNNWNLQKQNLNAVYHDPCELGRGSHIYNEPRNLLKLFLNLKDKQNYEKENSLCCGGSLGNFYLKENDRVKIAEHTYKSIMTKNDDCLITSCPLCKKTFQKISDKPVYDIAEVVLKSLKLN